MRRALTHLVLHIKMLFHTLLMHCSLSRCILLWILGCLFTACQAEENSAPQTTAAVSDTLCCPPESEEEGFSHVSHIARDKGFPLVYLADVCPDVLQEIRYHTTFNFVGQQIPGYDYPRAMLSRPAAVALKAVSDELITMGYRLKVFDAYRPQRAVNFFIAWAQKANDQRMKDYFYPDCPKSQLFRRGYLAHKSGHARGSTVDVTLFDMKTGKDVDMGSPYDLLGEASHYNHTQGLNAAQQQNRALLRTVMMRHGFRPIQCEWWHFTLKNEPFPNTYFDYPLQ